MDSWFNMAEIEEKEEREVPEKNEIKEIKPKSVQYCHKYPNCTREGCKFLHEKNPNKKDVETYKLEGIEFSFKQIKNIYTKIWMLGAVAGQTKQLDINRAFKEFLKSLK